MSLSYSPRRQLIGHHDLVICVGHEQPQRVLQYILDELFVLLHLHGPSLAAAQVTFDLLAVLGRVHAAKVITTVVAT